MPKRECLGCRRLIASGTRCARCDAPRKAAKSQRYGAGHQAARRHWAAILEEHGSLPCTRCHEPVLAGQPFDLDHDDADPTRYAGVAHPAPCNRGRHPLVGGG